MLPPVQDLALEKLSATAITTDVSSPGLRWDAVDYVGY